MKCQKCENEIEQNAKFCGNCGQPIPNSTASQQPSNITEASREQSSNIKQIQPNQAQNKVDPNQSLISRSPQQPPLENTTTNNTTPSNNNGMAVASLMLAVPAIPGSLIPIIGFLFGITSVVFGTLSLKSQKRGMAMAGIVVGLIAILLSLVIFAYAFSAALKKGTQAHIINTADSAYQEYIYKPTNILNQIKQSVF